MTHKEAYDAAEAMTSSSYVCVDTTFGTGMESVKKRVYVSLLGFTDWHYTLRECIEQLKKMQDEHEEATQLEIRRRSTEVE